MDCCEYALQGAVVGQMKEARDLCAPPPRCVRACERSVWVWVDGLALWLPEHAAHPPFAACICRPLFCVGPSFGLGGRDNCRAPLTHVCG